MQDLLIKLFYDNRPEVHFVLAEYCKGVYMIRNKALVDGAQYCVAYCGRTSGGAAWTGPEAVTAFLEGESFEDVIRTAVSLGGDCDTLTCIAGSMAEAFYGVPEELKAECRKRVTPEMREVLDRFDQFLEKRAE